MDKDFLLETKTAQKLFHEYADKMPIVDYHCHINPQEIAEDRKFENITQVWLGGDHYKWRQMRSNGVDEYYITGEATDCEKFQKWAETLEKLIGNPQMGRNIRTCNWKPTVSLESFRAAEIFRISWSIKWRYSRRSMESVQ